jgi:uncharacterized alpha-E superfamily protein
MLSRVAASIHWMSRYVERAENVARFMDVANNLSLGDSSPYTNQWSPLVYTTGDHQDFEKRYADATREHVLEFLLFDAENPNSILSCISNAREQARTIREVLPTEIWEQLNKFWRLVVEASHDRNILEQPSEFCETVRMTSHLIIGVAQSAMLRDEAWSFFNAGLLIERADKTSRIVDVQYFLLLPQVEDVGTSIDINRWSSLLRSADALQMYRRTHGRISTDKVAEFLILEPNFPRSIRFCVEQLLHSITSMRDNSPQWSDLQSEFLVRQLADKLKDTSIDEIIGQGMHAFIDQLQGALNSIGNAINGDFFDTRIQQQRFFSQSQSQGQ